MHFDLKKTNYRKTYSLLSSLILPRPIALITTKDAEGRLNAAPYSAYNYLGIDPPIVGIGVSNKPGTESVGKDTARNIRSSREFVVNVVTEDIAEAMNICAVDFPFGVNELEVAGLTTENSTIVSVPRIREAHAALECREISTIEIGYSRIILGEVVALFVEDRFMDQQGNYVLTEELNVLGRMNGLGNYVRTKGAFLTMPRITYEEWLKNNKGK